MRSKFVAAIFFLIWGVAYFSRDWNGWGALLFATFCTGGIASILRTGITNSAQLEYMKSSGSINSHRNIMGKVCKNSACEFQNGWTAFKCKRCGRFLGV